MSYQVKTFRGGHPRLFFTSEERAKLRDARARGRHARIWKQLEADADWCLTRPIRAEWIAPAAVDPIYENLYDRFYGMMHDMGVAEHLAFAAAIGGDDRHVEGAARWARALAQVWIREADGDANADKAYAATRVLKGMAVAYDLLFDRIDDATRALLRDAIAAILAKYTAFFVAKGSALFCPGYEPHHASVEASSLGLAALAVVGEVEGAEAWVDFYTRWHADYLLEHALTPSGTHNQTSNFYISVTQYRVAFMDALRRVTGRDLFREYERFMRSPMPLAAAVGGGRRAGEPCAQTNQSWLHGPSYGQIDYAAPMLLALAREYRDPLLQRIALWDEWLGGVQKTRYVSRRGDTMVFAWGGYAYAWLDESVSELPETPAKLSWLFSDTASKEELDAGYLHVREAYARETHEPGALAVGFVRGNVCLHGGGSCLLADLPHHDWPPPQHVWDMALEDDGTRAAISMTKNPGEPAAMFDSQSFWLDRARRAMRLERRTQKPAKWWCHGPVRFDEATQTLTWPHGTTLKITRGSAAFDPRGFEEAMIVGMGKLRLDDPMPCVYPTLTVTPDAGVIEAVVAAGRVGA